MIKETTITIGDKEYLIKKSYRSLLEFEEQTGKAITSMQETLKDLLMFFYCIVISNNKTQFNFYEFVNLIDENQEVMEKFNKYLVDSATTNEDLPVKKKKVNQSK